MKSEDIVYENTASVIPLVFCDFILVLHDLRLQCMFEAMILGLKVIGL